MAASGCSPTPSAGYLLGWVAGAFVAGLLAGLRAERARLASLLVAAVVGGVAVVYAFGVPVLAWRAHLSLGHALATSWVFLPGDLAKAAVAAVVAAARRARVPPARAGAPHGGGPLSAGPGAGLTRALAAREPGEPALHTGVRQLTVAEVLALADAAVATPTGRSELAIEGAHPAVAVPALVGALRAGRTPLVVAPGTGAAAVAELAAALARASNAPGRDPGPLLALPTSGTTSAPRCVLRTAGSWDAALAPFTELAGTGPDDVAWAPGTGASTLTLWALWHALSTGVPALATGPWRGVPAGPAAVEVLDRVTVLHAVPAVLADVLAARAAGGLPALRTAVVAGAALPAGLRRRASEAGVRVVEYYGAAELSFVAADSPWADGAGLRPFPGCEVRVRDGSVEVRSPYVALGYVLPAGRGTRPLVPRRRWLGRGRRPRPDRRGRALEIAGRGDGALSVGGHVVLAVTSSACSARVDGVLEVACVGRPDPRLGQRPVAVVAGPPAGRTPRPWSASCGRRRGRPAGAAPVLRGTPWSTTCRGHPAGKPDLGRLAELLARTQVERRPGERAVGPTAAVRP